MVAPDWSPGMAKLPGTQGADTPVHSLSAAVKPDARAGPVGVGGIQPPLPKPWQLPPHGLAVFQGETPRFSHYFLPRLLLEGKRVLFLDGANCADPRLLERLARQRNVPFAQFNRRIQIARAFTCFQLTELIARVPQFLADFPAQVLIVTAFPELYFDEDVRDWDARVAFAQALAHLRRLVSVAAGSPLAVAVFSEAANHTGLAPSPARQCFFNQVCATAGEVWKFTRGEDNRLGLTCKRAMAGATSAPPLHGGSGDLRSPNRKIAAPAVRTPPPQSRGALWAER